MPSLFWIEQEHRGAHQARAAHAAEGHASKPSPREITWLLFDGFGNQAVPLLQTLLLFRAKFHILWPASTQKQGGDDK